jgi:hypothetical protein
VTKLGYWASQEQYSMKDLFEFVKEASFLKMSPVLDILDPKSDDW